MQGAIDAAIRNGSDAVILNAADRDAYAKQIADAEAAGVQFVTCCSLATAGDGLLYNTATDKQNGPIGDYLAAEVVTDSGGKANALYVNISAFEILAQVGKTFEDGMKKYCPSCSVDSLDIPLTSLGKDAPDRIISYLRSHPDVNYIALSVTDALGAGLPGGPQGRWSRRQGDHRRPGRRLAELRRHGRRVPSRRWSRPTSTPTTT